MLIEVKVKVNATDVMVADIMRAGIQNVLNELGEHQAILADLSNPVVAADYRNKLMTIIDNPIVKKMANIFSK